MVSNVLSCSVERILAYTTEYPAEKAAIILGARPPQNWPSQGKITLNKLVVRYRPDLPPVLKGLSLSIQAREKVRARLSSHLTFLVRCAVKGFARSDGDTFDLSLFLNCAIKLRHVIFLPAATFRLLSRIFWSLQVGVAGRTGGGKSTLMMVRSVS